MFAINSFFPAAFPYHLPPLNHHMRVQNVRACNESASLSNHQGRENDCTRDIDE
jgi:hypothetical protein